MSYYIPSMRQVRDVWCESDKYGGPTNRPGSDQWAKRKRGFDDWLNELKREVWEEGFERSLGDDNPLNPYDLYRDDAL